MHRVWPREAAQCSAVKPSLKRTNAIVINYAIRGFLCVDIKAVTGFCRRAITAG